MWTEINENLDAILEQLEMGEGKREPADMLKKARLAGDMKAVAWWSQVLKHKLGSGKAGAGPGADQQRPKVKGHDYLKARATISKMPGKKQTSGERKADLKFTLKKQYGK